MPCPRTPQHPGGGRGGAKQQLSSASRDAQPLHYEIKPAEEERSGGGGVSLF